MDRFTGVLRHIIIFIFPIPFLLGFAVQPNPGWAEYVAYAAVAVLVAVAAVVAVGAMRRGD